MKRQWFPLLLCALTLAVGTSMLIAQEARTEGDRPSPERREGDRSQRGEGDRGQRRGPSEAERQEWMQRARDRMSAELKERLGANDEEWAVIRPRLEKVSELRVRSAMGGGFGFRGRGSDGGAGDRPVSEIDAKSRALREAIDANASPEKLKQAMTELRAARQKQQAEAKAAADHLREVLSLKQEAVLVSMGILE
jgi:hypothetical protein